MKDRLIESCGAWQIATTPSKSGDGFVGWAKMGPITGVNPVVEPGNHIWFQFGATREQAADRLRAELGLPPRRS